MKNIFLTFAISLLSITILAFVALNKLEPRPSFQTSAFKLETIVENVDVPWEIVFLPDSSMLFTERPGRLRIFKKGKLVSSPIFELTDIDTTKKMGLLGLTLHPEFVTNNILYLAYNYKNNGRSWLRVVRYQLQKDSLLNPKTIIENIPANQNHTGCRLKFGSDNKLYISTGDADEAIKAQSLEAYNGKILRVNDDGSIPDDNPFINFPNAHHEIWSYGHRNSQGLAFQPGSNRLFISEHGPNGGDEVNIVNKGNNYGWPVIHHQLKNDSMVDPLLEFTPSIGPSEAIFYNSNTIPELKGHLLVACLRGEAILNVELNGESVVKYNFLLQKEIGRIRALCVGPEGYIYLSTSQKDPPEGKPGPDYDKIVRLVPGNGSITITKSLETSAVSKTPVKKAALISKTAKLFIDMCSNCHGKKLEGSQWAKAIKKGQFKHGSSLSQVITSIKTGYPQLGMPSWEGAIQQQDIKNLAGYVIQLTK